MGFVPRRFLLTPEYLSGYKKRFGRLNFKMFPIVIEKPLRNRCLIEGKLIGEDISNFGT
jgi:hypothetical protein